MKFLFEDDTFSFEALRTAGLANYFGADLGEVLATAARITDGDEASCHQDRMTRDFSVRMFASEVDG